MVIWIIGLSGSGKTTLANILKKKLTKKKYRFIHVDGDAVRKIYDKKVGYSFKERSVNAKRISFLVKFLASLAIYPGFSYGGELLKLHFFLIFHFLLFFQPIQIIFVL